MTTSLLLKLGQIAGAILMVVGVTACNMGQIEDTPMLMLSGGTIYGACRIGEWLRSDDGKGA